MCCCLFIGTAAVCPTDARAAPGTQCRAANGLCDAPELCDGLLSLFVGFSLHL
jgi:hypothetical protein